MLLGNYFPKKNQSINSFFFRNNYNMLLTLQFKPFPPRSPSTLYMGRCQFRYKAFGNQSISHQYIYIYIYIYIKGEISFERA